MPVSSVPDKPDGLWIGGNIQENLDPILENSILELFSIGAGHSATALSSLMDQTVMISVPRLRVIMSHELPEVLGSVEEEQIMVLIRMRDNDCCLLFIVGQKEGHNIVESWMKCEIPEDPVSFKETVVPGIVESGNIIGGTFVSVIGEITSQQMIPQPPDSAVDFLGGMLDSVAVMLDAKYLNILLFDVVMSIGGHDLSAHLALIPSSDLLASLIEAGRNMLSS